MIQMNALLATFFWPRDPMHERGLRCRAVSVMLMYCIESGKDTAVVAIKCK